MVGSGSDGGVSRASVDQEGTEHEGTEHKGTGHEGAEEAKDEVSSVHPPFAGRILIENNK